MVHIGKKIEEKFLESGIKANVFAEKIGTVPRNIYHIFKKSSIDTILLKKICAALKYDFFRYYFDYKLDGPKLIKLTSEQPKRMMISVEVEDEEMREKLITILTKT